MNTLSNAAALTALVTFVTSLLKPLVELLPFARPDAPLHDWTLRVLNVLLNLAAVFILASLNHQSISDNLLQLLVQAFGQAAGAQLLYSTTTRVGSSVNSPSKAKPV